MLVVLVVVGAYVLLKPDARATLTELRFAGHRHTIAAMLTGLAIGFYDGALGPGTGSFFVFTLVGLLGYNFLEASAKARLANWATNLARAVRLRAAGRRCCGGSGWRWARPTWSAATSARGPPSPGPRFVRVFFIVVVSAFIVRIGGELLGFWG